jgi:hypothetical protein
MSSISCNLFLSTPHLAATRAILPRTTAALNHCSRTNGNKSAPRITGTKSALPILSISPSIYLIIQPPKHPKSKKEMPSDVLLSQDPAVQVPYLRYRYGDASRSALGLSAAPKQKDPTLSDRVFSLPSDVLLSQDPAVQVPSALKSLTSVFGMGTGVTSSPSSLDNLWWAQEDSNFRPHDYQSCALAN